MHAARKALAEISFQVDYLGTNALVGINMTANNSEGGATAASSTGILAYGTAIVVTSKSNRRATHTK